MVWQEREMMPYRWLHPPDMQPRPWCGDKYVPVGRRPDRPHPPCVVGANRDRELLVARGVNPNPPAAGYPPVVRKPKPNRGGRKIGGGRVPTPRRGWGGRRKKNPGGRVGLGVDNVRNAAVNAVDNNERADVRRPHVEGFRKCKKPKAGLQRVPDPLAVGVPVCEGGIVGARKVVDGGVLRGGRLRVLELKDPEPARTVDAEAVELGPELKAGVENADLRRHKRDRAAPQGAKDAREVGGGPAAIGVPPKGGVKTTAKPETLRRGGAAPTPPGRLVDRPLVPHPAHQALRDVGRYAHAGGGGGGGGGKKGPPRPHPPRAF